MPSDKAGSTLTQAGYLASTRQAQPTAERDLYMTSIRDIAKRAGASVTTVSRVINDSGYVSAATRARVEQAIAELQFTPSNDASLATALKSAGFTG